MAMTKKELAEWQAKLDKLELIAALRFTEPVLPDIPAPKYGEEETRGWAFNEYAKRIEQRWSSATGNGPVIGGKRGTAGQGSMNLYSTRELAVKAMRHALELKFARDLRDVDRIIEK